MNNVAIELKNVSKDYYIYKNNFSRIMGIVFDKKASEVKHALKGISLKINKGEKIHLLGATDSGCSTLLKIISGVTYPTKGKVIVNGTINSYLDKNVGLDSELPCLDNIYLKANVVGVPKKEVKKREQEIIKYAGLEKHLALPLKRAPRGTQTKLSLYIHLLAHSDIFILDDKLNQGGAELRKYNENKLKEYIDEHPKLTVIVTGPTSAFSKQVCSRGIILTNGEVTFDGSLTEALDIYKSKPPARAK